MHAIITCYMLLLYYTQFLWFMYRGVFTVGVVATRGKGLSMTDAITDYSYVTNNGVNGNRLAHCLTGRGPSDNDNGVLGGLYFEGNIIPNRASCGSDVIQARPAASIAGVINIDQCRRFTTGNEGIYTCTMINSAMINQSVRFGIYFAGRSESLDLYIYIII